MKKLSLKPIKLTDYSWYYEEKKGLCIVYEVSDNRGNFIKTIQIVLPKRLLLKSADKYL